MHNIPAYLQIVVPPTAARWHAWHNMCRDDPPQRMCPLLNQQSSAQVRAPGRTHRDMVHAAKAVNDEHICHIGLISLIVWADLVQTVATPCINCAWITHTWHTLRIKRSTSLREEYMLPCKARHLACSNRKWPTEFLGAPPCTPLKA